jgi:hypothetical protein
LKRTLAVLATVAVLAVPLAGCGKHQSVTGTVVGKEKDHECSKKRKKKSPSCHMEYELTVRTKGKGEVEVDVTSSAYDDCVRGSRYPKCTRR